MMCAQSVSPHMAQIILHLKTIRREIRDLETEEQVIRQELLHDLEDWPPESFPVRVGAVELRVQHRQGRLDYEQALQVLGNQGLLGEANAEGTVRNQEALAALRIAISQLSMPKATRQQLTGHFEQAVQFRPAVGTEWLQMLYKNHVLDDEMYGRCFKDQKPVVPVLVVR